MKQHVKTLVGVLALAGLGYLWASRSGGDAATPGPAAASAGSEQAASKSAKSARAIQVSDIPVVIDTASRPYPGEVFARERSLFAYAQSPEELSAIEESRRLLAEKQALEAEERRIRDEELRVQREKDAALQAERDAAARVEREAYLALHPPKPVAPLFPYAYVGIVGPKGDAHAILRGGGSKLSYARAGDIIDSKFRVERVAKFVLDLTYTDPQFAGEISQIERTLEGAGVGSGAPSPAGRR